MRKVILSALVVFGCMSFCIGQANVNFERISVKKYDAKGITESFRLKGDKALSFDVAEYIKENDQAERLVIKGQIRTALSTTIINFDSNKTKDQEGDYICKHVESKKTPFLGVYGTGGNDFTGVDIKSIIPSTSAQRAGMKKGDIITQYNGTEISTFCDLKGAVSASEIGSKVALQLQSTTKQYSKNVIVGSRGVETITYKYCLEEPTEVLAANRNTEAASFTAFPNPTRSMSQVNFSSPSNEEVIFSVTDITGRLIYKKEYSNFDGNLQLDYNLDTENNGTYILHIQQGKEMYNRKVQLIKE